MNVCGNVWVCVRFVCVWMSGGRWGLLWGVRASVCVCVRVCMCVCLAVLYCFCDEWESEWQLLHQSKFLMWFYIWRINFLTWLLDIQWKCSFRHTSLEPSPSKFNNKQTDTQTRTIPPYSCRVSTIACHKGNHCGYLHVLLETRVVSSDKNPRWLTGSSNRWIHDGSVCVKGTAPTEPRFGVW